MGLRPTTWICRIGARPRPRTSSAERAAIAPTSARRAAASLSRSPRIRRTMDGGRTGASRSRSTRMRRPVAAPATERRAWGTSFRAAAGTLVLLVIVGLAAREEARASDFQARYFTQQASQLTNEIREGPSDRIRFPGAGPYD